MDFRFSPEQEAFRDELRAFISSELGLVPNSEASIAKLYSTELQSRYALAALGLTGQAGALARGSAHALLDGRFAAYYLAAASYTIAAGTSEVQCNIIAQRGLGLRRDEPPTPETAHEALAA